jgi:hypothetical protein
MSEVVKPFTPMGNAQGGPGGGYNKRSGAFIPQVSSSSSDEEKDMGAIIETI